MPLVFIINSVSIFFFHDNDVRISSKRRRVLELFRFYYFMLFYRNFFLRKCFSKINFESFEIDRKQDVEVFLIH